MWGTGKPGRWSEIDLLLLQAFQMYEDGLCGGCGQPLIHSTDDQSHDLFPLKTTTCYACTGLEGEAKKDPPGNGVKRYVANEMSKGWGVIK